MSLSRTLALYRQRSENLRAVLVLFPLGVVLSLFLARLIHWYFNTEIYGSFHAAFTDFDLGSFSIPWVILGVWLAAWCIALACAPTAGCCWTAPPRAWP